MSPTSERQLLLIEDNPGDARLVTDIFREASASDFRLHWADRLSTGLDRLAKGDIDLVLLDLGLPDSRGFSTFAQVHSRAPLVPVILLTGNDDETTRERAHAAGAHAFAAKDIRRAALLEKIDGVLDRPHVPDSGHRPEGGTTPGSV